MTGLVSQNGMARLMYILAALVLILVAICGFFVLNSAGSIADDLHREDTKLLVKNELTRQIDIVARDQSQISNWNDTLEAFGEEIDMDFVREEIAEWLWADFGIQSTVVIGPDAKPRATVLKEEVLLPKEGSVIIAQNTDLIKAARELYYKNREAVDGGYVFTSNPIASETLSYFAAFRSVDGELGIFLAQAIVPNTTLVLPEGNPHILLVFKPITQDILNDIGSKLNFKNFEFSQTPPIASQHQASVQIGKSKLWAVWQENKPSTAIWKQSIPLISVILLLVGTTLAVLSIRYGRLLAQLYKKQEENRFLALHDGLTNLPNRIQFNRLVSKITDNEGFSGCAILCIDLDRFKAVNDTFGHHAGDAVLIAVAARISDAVGDKGVVARMGGDEFTVLLRDISNPDTMLDICNEIVSSVSKEVSFEGGVSNVGASIGVAHWPNLATTAKLVMRSADKALYQAKENGRGCIFIADTTHQVEQLDNTKAI